MAQPRAQIAAPAMKSKPAQDTHLVIPFIAGGVGRAEAHFVSAKPTGKHKSADPDQPAGGAKGATRNHWRRTMF